MTALAEALRRVFGKPAYAFLALGIGTATFAMAVWMPNLGLIGRVLLEPSIGIAEKAAFPLALLGSITTNFTLLTASYTVAIAILFGVNVALLAYFLKRRVVAARGSGMTLGAAGMVSATLGVGCAACGSLLLASGLSLVGASGALALMPLRGGEFGIAGVALLGTSAYLTAKRIQDPAVCDSD